MQTPLLPAMLWLLAIGLPLVPLIVSKWRVKWSLAHLTACLSLFLALAAWIVVVAGTVTKAQYIAAVPWLSLTALNATLLVLITFLSLIVLRYARRNLAGDPDDHRFLRWLQLTVFAVAVTITSNHLVVFWFGWVSISLCLHQLLMFYPDRPRAALAAHKKFILARFAELMLATAFWLLYDLHQTALISDIVALYPGGPNTWQLQMATVLIGMVALIKCAQLPVHGWLIQVVESPTPVSALLHAGVINLGGFLLLMFAPVFSEGVLAQWMVLLIAGPSAALAALITVTRISVKVRLAWSTSAQMGFMLVECALGLYELALLHLLAHSCYKAYAFLSAGEEVKRYLQNRVYPAAAPGKSTWIIAGMAAALMIGAATLSSYKLGGDTMTALSGWLLIAFATTVLIAYAIEARGKKLLPLLQGAALVLAYSVLKPIVATLLPTTTLPYNWLADLYVAIVFSLLFVLWAILVFTPAHAKTRSFFIALNAGFYLDEWATRMTLRLWPIHIPRSNVKANAVPQEVL